MNPPKLLKALAIAGIGAISGVGLAASPAQAGNFVFEDIVDAEWCQGLSPDSLCPGSGSTNSPIWVNTFPEKTNPSFVEGWENPLISFVSDPGYSGATILVEYFGSGNSADTNLFKMNGIMDGIAWCSPGNQSCDDLPPLPDGSSSGFDSADFSNMSYTDVGSQPPDWGGLPSFTQQIMVNDGVLDFSFLADAVLGSGSLEHQVIVTNGGQYPNGCEPNSPPCTPNEPTGAPHYFATFDGTLNTTVGEVFYMGLSDEAGEDDDAEDFLVRVSVLEQKKAPEPGTILGLLAMGGLGLASKRKKQK